MEYTKDTIVGSVTTYEVFEGTPQEILELVNGLDNREDSISTLDMGDLIKFILDRTGLRLEDIEKVLDLEEEYMKLVGIINDWVVE